MNSVSLGALMTYVGNNDCVATEDGAIQTVATITGTSPEVRVETWKSLFGTVSAT